MEFSRQEDWRRSTFPSPGIEFGSPALQADSFPSEHEGSPISQAESMFICKRWFCSADRLASDPQSQAGLVRGRLLSQGALITASPRLSPYRGLLSEHCNSQPCCWELKQQALLAIQPSRGA